ncbi:MAG: redox-sensing transcriptional repressor Rex [Clostridia bacterium]|nr:redox-sensing transcriptional repressor Rex [Clostridia bacterium]
MGKENISMSVIRRLPRYYRYLCELENNGILRVSSKELSSRMGFTASQIRQDFNCFGGFGQQGYGYPVSQLKQEISDILGLGSKRKAILLGVGNLGRALLSISFEKMGFDLVGLFDVNNRVVGTEIKGYTVMHYSALKEFCEKEKPEMAIICIPSSAVNKVSDDLISYGVKAFWNFSHTDISMRHPEVSVEGVHLNDSLMTMSYMLNFDSEK